jgi:hypothetical protein
VSKNPHLDKLYNPGSLAIPVKAHLSNPQKRRFYPEFNLRNEQTVHNPWKLALLAAQKS